MTASLYAAAALLFASAGETAATMLSWPAPPGWTAGAPTPGQTASQDFTALFPNDVTVSINNNGSNVTGASWQSGYPAISNTPISGGSPANGIQLYVSSQSSTSAYVQLTVAFAYPVIGLAFQIWDVDSGGQYIDRISNIEGYLSGGGTVAATSITSAVAGYNIITGSGLATVVSGTATANNSTNQGTIDITFDGPVTGFSFRYGNSDPAVGSQGIALGPLTFTMIPEPAHIGAACAGLILLVIGAEWYRSRRKTVRQS